MRIKACLPLFLCALAGTVLAADSTAEQALRNTDDQWAKAAGAHDVAKTVSFYTDDAIVLPPNAPSLTGKDARESMWKQILGDMSAMSWKATRVEVAGSGELGYVTGTYEMTIKNEKGAPINDCGKYLEVWKKQADGSWKCAADMFSSDVPTASPAK